jgi:hypothetical protein
MRLLWQHNGLQLLSHWTKYLHIQPLDSVEPYIKLYNESNPNPITPEEIDEAKKHWAFASNWCNQRSTHFSTPKGAEVYLQRISESNEVFIGA